MIQLIPSVDPRLISAKGPTTFLTERNDNEVRCGMCGGAIYVDDDTYEFGSEAIESGLNSPYRCEKCAEEYDDLAYEG